MTGENGIVVINQVDVEEYLTSVISSEMSAAGFEGTVKGTCRHFTQLAARTDRKELPPGKERGEAAKLLPG